MNAALLVVDVMAWDADLIAPRPRRRRIARPAAPVKRRRGHPVRDPDRDAAEAWRRYRDVEPMSQREVGIVLRLPVSEVQRIEASALAKLRRAYLAGELDADPLEYLWLAAQRGSSAMVDMAEGPPAQYPAHGDVARGERLVCGSSPRRTAP